MAYSMSATNSNCFKNNLIETQRGTNDASVATSLQPVDLVPEKGKEESHLLDAYSAS